MRIVQFGLYSLKNDFFDKFSDKFLPDNKNENRPYFCSFIDSKGIIWFIPLSSQVESYKLKINSDESKYGQCLFYYIGTIAGKNSVFLIGDMFPVSEKYVKKEYTYNDVHYVIKNKSELKEIQKRAKKYIALIRNKKLNSNINIGKILSELKKEDI